MQTLSQARAEKTEIRRLHTKLAPTRIQTPTSKSQSDSTPGDKPGGMMATEAI
jgi:hypothetical protein